MPVDTSSHTASSRAASVAARVAARYANAPTYAELLANEARNVARAASAAADAAREAHAAAEAILQGLDLHPEESLQQAEAARPVPAFEEPSELQFEEPAAEPVMSAPAPQRLLEPKTVVTPPDFTQRQTAPEALVSPRREALFPEAPALTSEASFIEPAEPIPGNLIEFPRVLVAPKKARPRLAEGPLAQEDESEIGQAQLSIFEAEAGYEAPVQEQHPAEGASLPSQSVAEWSSIQLEAQPKEATATAKNTANSLLAELPLSTASIEDRFMAGVVDAALVLLGFLAFVAVFVACTPHLPEGKIAWISSGISVLAFHFLYQYLFFSLSDSTPGMRYASIALCTFDDENPTRQQMRKRIPYSFLSLAAMGLGLLWAFFDEERLGWHDRITHTYQRSYK